MIVQDKPRICFVHIPRSAGTSIRWYLEQIFSKEETLEFREEDKIRLARDRKNRSLIRQYRLYSGHYDFRTFRALLPRNTRYLTMLRDPVQRIISLYYFWRSYRPDFAQAHIVYPDGPRLARELSLPDFLRCKETIVINSIFNLQARQLGGFFYKPLSGIDTGSLISDAEKNLIGMDFFGITEDFNSSIKLLHSIFGWPVPEKEIMVNTFEKLDSMPHAFIKVERDQKINEETQALLYSLTEADRRMYDIAKVMFKTRCAEIQGLLSPAAGSSDEKTTTGKEDETAVVRARSIIKAVQPEHDSIDSRAEIESLRRELERLHVAIRDIHGSISWRITKPLRLTGYTLKSLPLLLDSGTSASGLVKKTWKVLRTYGPGEVLARLRRRIEIRNTNKQKPVPSQPSPSSARKRVNPKTCFYRMCELQLDLFLSDGSSMDLPHANDPLVSIVIVTFNKAPLTYSCLRSIAACTEVPMEVIVVDNASEDRTRKMIERLRNVRTIMNERNEHYLSACRQGSEEAAGKYLLFLNNDIQLFPGSIESAVATLETDDTIGALGGKILQLDGTLQEAGCMVFRDGRCKGYGRGKNPFAPPYSFRRDVDFCSGAFLLTRRDLYERLGGLDEDFTPAYYEDVDYCLRLRQAGYRIVYDPSINVIHYEFGSSRPEEAERLMERNRKIFVAKHAGILSRHQSSSACNVHTARFAPGKVPRVLYIDDRIPHVCLGSGFPRSNAILRALQNLDWFTTFFPTTPCPQSWKSVYTDLPREVEVIVNGHRENLAEFLEERTGYYDAILISRPHNMELLQNLYRKNSSLKNGIPVIYDAEAIFALREIERRNLLGRAPSEKEANRLIETEISQARASNSVITVSSREKDHFTGRGFKKVFVLGHAITPDMTETPFEKRTGFLFVGAMHDEMSPNADSVVWFTTEVLPRIRRRLSDGNARFYVVGYNRCENVWALAGDAVQVIGTVEDLRPYYEAARVFVAPTRFGAGVPLKIYEAYANGIPVVTTRLCERQLGWNAPEHLLSAETGDPDNFAACCVRLYTDDCLWEKVRAGGMKKVKEECSQERFAGNLRRILKETGQTMQTGV